MELKIVAWATTDPGLERSNNEDAFLCEQGSGVFAVCDGMGGHAAGERASGKAIQVLRQQLLSHRLLREEWDEDQEQEQRQELIVLLQSAVQKASQEIFQLARTERSLHGMGTTCTVLVVRAGRAFLAHVGDSRAYLQRLHQVHQLTEDHTVIAELMRRKHELSADVIEKIPFRNNLTRAVGLQPMVEVDLVELELLPGDWLMLCSDGLHRYVNDDTEALARIMEQGGIETASSRLVEFAKKSGGEDNVTVVVLEVRSAVSSVELVQAMQQSYHSALQGISRSQLFSKLDHRETLELLAAAEDRTYRRGQLILRQSEPGDAMYILVEGDADVLVNGTKVAQLSPGNLIGEMALVYDLRQSASIRAATDVKLKRLRRSALQELLRGDLQIASKVQASMIRTLSEQVQQLSEEKVALQLEMAQLRENVEEEPDTDATRVQMRFTDDP